MSQQTSSPSSSSYKNAATSKPAEFDASSPSHPPYHPVSIDQSHEYRLGAPGNLRELPLLIQYPEPTSPILQSWLNIESDVLDILRAQISEFQTVFVQRYEPGDRPTDLDWTILVTTEKKTPQDTEKWKAAVDSILKINRVMESHFQVEIMDPRATQYSFLPEVDDSFANAWESWLNESIRHVLGKGPWRTLTLYNRGNTEATAKPTVTIGIKKTDADNKEWKATTGASIRGLLKDFPDIGIEFIRSSM